MNIKQTPKCPYCSKALTHIPSGVGAWMHYVTMDCMFFFECGKDKAKALELWARAGGEWVK